MGFDKRHSVFLYGSIERFPQEVRRNTRCIDKQRTLVIS